MVSSGGIEDKTKRHRHSWESIWTIYLKVLFYFNYMCIWVWELYVREHWYLWKPVMKEVKTLLYCLLPRKICAQISQDKSESEPNKRPLLHPPLIARSKGPCIPWPCLFLWSHLLLDYFLLYSTLGAKEFRVVLFFLLFWLHCYCCSLSDPKTELPINHTWSLILSCKYLALPWLIS